MPRPPQPDITMQLSGLAALLLGPKPLRRDQTEGLLAFCRLFLAWNKRINLGGASTVEELVNRHLVDSLAAARFMAPGDTAIDVGSGGGLPAIPLALLCPEVSLVLHEPRSRRVAFLRTAVRELGLKDRVRVSDQRVGGLQGSGIGRLDSGSRGRFSVAMSRATWPPKEWLERGKELVAPGGAILVFTTPAIAQGLPEPAAFVDYPLDRRLCRFALPS